MSPQPIFTLNARGNVFFEVLRKLFKPTSARLRAEIQRMHLDTVKVLSSKGIAYDNLRSALVPQADRNEAGFIFHSGTVNSSWYGYDAMRQLLPLLDKQATQSVLCGDLVGNDQSVISQILHESMAKSREISFRHSSELFCVYVNNLSDAALERLDGGLAAWPAYFGHIPTTFDSPAKRYLSLTLANAFLKSRHRIIMGHEEDRPDDEDVNILGYPFEECGYSISSLNSLDFGIFLSYKIERPVYEGFESDSEMALNAISDDLPLLKDFTVVLEEAKHNYLTTTKLGSLKQAGWESLDRDRIALLIKSKLAANYIYNMVYLAEHDVMKFNVLIEVDPGDGGHPARLTVALEYMPAEKVLRVITLY